MTQLPGRIYLADQRGLTATAAFQRYSTFHFGEYQAEYKEPLGHLLALNEETLAGGRQVELLAPQAAQVLLLPMTGAMEIQIHSGAIITVEVEEIRVVQVPAGSTLTLRNPFAAELVSCLHIWLAADSEAVDGLFTFDFQQLENQLIEVLPSAPGRRFALSLGRLAGRHEAVYKLRSRESLFFAFVLAGAFELEGRLLHEKDGLALWEAEEVELEALSTTSLVVVLEVL